MPRDGWSVVMGRPHPRNFFLNFKFKNAGVYASLLQKQLVAGNRERGGR